MKTRFRSLKSKILLPYLAIGLLLSLLGTVYIQRHLTLERELIIEQRAQTLSDSIGFFIDAAAATPSSLQRTVESMGTELDVRFLAVVLGESETVLVSTQRHLSGRHISELPAGTEARVYRSLREKRPLLLYSAQGDAIEYYCPIQIVDPNSPGRIVAASVIIQLDLSMVHAELAGRRSSVFGFFLLNIVWLVIPGLILLRTFVFDRIEHLRGVIEKRASGDPQAFADDNYEDEIGDVASALNNMLSSLDRSQTELERFTYLASHDMRSPIINLRGFADEIQESCKTLTPLLQRVKNKLPEKDQKLIDELMGADIPESLHFIQSSVNRLELYTDSIMKLSRLGRRDLSFECLDLNQLVKSVINSFQHQIESLGIQVKVGKLPKVYADHFSMQQVLGNLIDNAIKYRDPERPCVIRITAEDRGDKWAIHVSDTGQGIAEAAQGKVFELFNRGQSPSGEGEGMGLTVVKTLLKRHKGDITCRSERGKGTTFTFEICKSLAYSGILRSRN